METLVMIIIILIISVLRNVANQVQQRRNRVPTTGKNNKPGKSPDFPGTNKTESRETDGEMARGREMDKDREVMREREIRREKELSRDREESKQSSDDEGKTTTNRQNRFPDIGLPEGVPEVPIPFGEEDSEYYSRREMAENYPGDFYKEDGTFIDDEVQRDKDKQQASKSRGKAKSRATRAYQGGYSREKTWRRSAEPMSLLDDRSDLKKAIVLTEVLGRPKSKRNFNL